MRHHAPAAIVIRADAIAEDEQRVSQGMKCTTPARTAYDMGRRLRGETAVIRIDALMNATGLSADEEVDARPGRRRRRIPAEVRNVRRRTTLHETDDYAKDIARLEFLANAGWHIVRVSARQLRLERAHILDRVRTALARRGAFAT